MTRFSDPRCDGRASLVTGAGWVLILIGHYSSAEHALPDWVRARGLAVFLTLVFGSVTVGASAGDMSPAGSGSTERCSSRRRARCSPSPCWTWKLARSESVDLTPSLHWRVPQSAQPIENNHGPVLVKLGYRIDPADREEFLRTVNEMGMERKRDGAFAGESSRMRVARALRRDVFDRIVARASASARKNHRGRPDARGRDRTHVAGPAEDRVSDPFRKAPGLVPSAYPGVSFGAEALRVLVFCAHPFAHKLHRSTARKASQVLRRTATKSTVRPLRGKVRPSTQPADVRDFLKVDSNTREVEAYVKRLRAADALALFFPVSFDRMPAIMQGYFQRVLLPGVATVIDEQGLFHRNMENLKRLSRVAAYGESRHDVEARVIRPRRWCATTSAG